MSDRDLPSVEVILFRILLQLERIADYMKIQWGIIE